MKDHVSATPAAYIFLKTSSGILLARRFNTGYEDGNYSFVAEHLKEHESPQHAARRAAQEEAGIDVDLESLALVHTMPRLCADGMRLSLFFAPQYWSGIPRIMEPHKCDDMRFFPEDNLPSNTIPYIRQAIACIGQGIHYSEFGF